MSSVEPESFQASSHDADEWGQYRSLSSLAVVAFLLGVGSLLMFVSPLLMVVPLAAVATALLALKGIAASDGGLSGAKLAHWGLALAILCSVASYARVKFSDVLLQRQADRVARQWLALAADGNAESMLEMMSRGALEKLTPAVAPGQPMPFFGKILASALIRHDPVVLGMSKLQGGEGSLRLKLANVGLLKEDQLQASLRYVASNLKAEPVVCLLALKRLTSLAGNVWQVDSWALE